MSQNIYYDKSERLTITKKARNFIRKLLRRNVEKRLTASTALK
jgi:hypothetical protein